MGKIAVITGIGGQDGSYLAELLLKKKYKIYGILNPKKKINLKNLESIQKNIFFKKIDINNSKKIRTLIQEIKPNEFYHLAAQSFVNYKFEDEFFKLNPNINGTHYILSSIKKYSPNTKFYFAASSELFGNPIESPQNEKTKFNPRSAYGISKVTGYHLTKNYREAYNLFACSGILFNHESPRRNIEFVTRKITYNLALILKNKKKKIELGNINAKRDWGHAKDYVEAMWKMLQQKKPQDFVIGSGKIHTVKDFIKLAFKRVDLNYKKYVKIDKKLFRNKENSILRADFSKAKKILKWKPKYSFKQLVNEMVDSDIK
ncbi:GDP-mannose 4,6-dehydratase [Candidatus Pelagibacter sp.]|uniref:GDP-mannose 4,6-dehydratase n=1 Tax=Candidatus Pelagibacter sp. TaxID=2024849 RepID=UPI003F867BCC